ncbi:13138_t:CDS:1, partial [Racocetra fulgida]
TDANTCERASYENLVKHPYIKPINTNSRLDTYLKPDGQP